MKTYTVYQKELCLPDPLPFDPNQQKGKQL